MKSYLKATDTMITAALKAFKTKGATSDREAVTIIIEAALLQRHKDKISAGMKKNHEKRRKNLDNYIQKLKLSPTEVRRLIIQGLRSAA